MCGYLGIISNKNQEHSIEILKQANKRIICRGPNETKCMFSSDLETHQQNTFSFIFNRLSIIDLSLQASQPMLSDKYKNVILFNGEIYNHRELRKDLENHGINFKSTHSDTEVILNGISVFGLSFIDKLIGQFAITFYDQLNEKIYLIRDRLGQKPLFYSLADKSLTFGSNLLSVSELSGESEVDSHSINEYLNIGIVQSPRTLIKNITKLKPGEIVTIDLKDYSISSTIYWDIEKKVGNKKFSKKKFFDLLTSSIKYRLESDVPVAAFLSGGIDSTSVVKNLFEQGVEINTFSAVYEDELYDESEWIDLVADKYSTKQKMTKLDSEMDLDKIFEAIDAFDEVYCDPSIVPTYFLSNEIAKFYSVAISGDGGDELLGGYSRLKKTLSKPNIFNHLYSMLYYLYPSFLGTGNHFLVKSSLLKTRYASFFEDVKLLKILNLDKDNNFEDNIVTVKENNYKSLLMTDYKFYLPEMMMLKIDRASMANSLEVRSPFIDHRLVEYIMAHDTDYFNIENPKRILKDYLSNDFDEDFLNRPKMGFVFNLENFVFTNFEEISNYIIQNNEYFKDVSKPLKKLSKYKTRMNAIRIFKILILTRYLKQNFS
jgi:asparagine synthase (glutamine-hydrolysing)